MYKKLVQKILQNLFNIIREINVFVAPFKPLREVELHEEEEIQNEQCSRFIVSISFNSDRNGHRRRYNLPAVNEIALFFQNQDGELPFHRDFKVYPRNDETLLINLNILSPNLDLMTFAIFFPFGEPGWQPMMESNDRQGTNLRRRKLTMLQYKISKTAIKDGEINELLHGRELFQQWIVESSLQF